MLRPAIEEDREHGGRQIQVMWTPHLPYCLNQKTLPCTTCITGTAQSPMHSHCIQGISLGNPLSLSKLPINYDCHNEEIVSDEGLLVRKAVRTQERRIDTLGNLVSAKGRVEGL